MWSEERMTFKTGRGGGRKIKTIVKGGGSYATDYAESFESLKSFPKTVTADRGMFYIVGVARLRQLRVKKGNIYRVHGILIFFSSFTCEATHTKCSAL